MESGPIQGADGRQRLFPGIFSHTARAIALHGLGREIEARQTVERCESMASNYLATKNYDEYFNHWLLAFCARFQRQHLQTPKDNAVAFDDIPGSIR
jgi:hypothetical protein